MRTTSLNGSPAFRSVLRSGRWKRHDPRGPRSATSVTHGCIEALNVAPRAVAQPGDIVAVESHLFRVVAGARVARPACAGNPTSPQTGISLEAPELAKQTYPT